MKKFLALAATCLLCFVTAGQPAQKLAAGNLGLEVISAGNLLPDGWFQTGSGYTIQLDSSTKNKNTIRIAANQTGPANSFGGIACSFPAGYEGKEITLTARIKLDNVAGGFAGLMVRIDGAGGVLAFDNMQQRKLHGTADWSVYTVSLPYPKEARTIHIGALLSGSGQLWVNDFRVQIDGKDLKDLRYKAPVAFPAEKDHAFDTSSGLANIPLTAERIADLALLGKVWGFVKYYHPAVATGNYNWDYELFRVLPKILAAANTQERNGVLYNWINRLGKVSAGKDFDTREEDITLLPELGWMSSSLLGDSLAQLLKTVQTAKRSTDNYYIGMVPGPGNPEFKHELPYANLQRPDAGFRLLCLFRYWNIIQYYYPYKKLIGENWNDVLTEFIPRFATATNSLSYKKTTLALVARIHDTHANVWTPDNELNRWRGQLFAPLEIGFIENKAVVTGFYNTVLGEQSGLVTGDIIEKINNTPVEDIIKDRLPLTPGSNYPTQLREIAPSLLRGNDSLITIAYRHKDSLFTRTIACYGTDTINLYGRYQKKDTCFKLIAPGIAYLHPGFIKNDYLPAIMPEVLKTKGLIIDFRTYPSDFTVFSLSKYLLPEKTSFVKFSTGSIVTPGLFTRKEYIKIGSSNRDAYKGKLVILINETTQSSAEFHCMAFRTTPGAVVLGSTTAGADGNVSRLFLPGDISTLISGIGVYCPDGTDTQRVGIIPDIEVKPTINGIKKGKDELLEKAIAIINAQ